METIRILFPVMHDPDAVNTVKYALGRAKHSERIKFGVYLLSNSKYVNAQFKEELKQFIGQIDIIERVFNNQDKFDYLGVGKGRKKCASLVKDGEYVLQLDSHHYFDQDWDETLINTYNQAEKELGLDKIILTGYNGVFENHTGNPIIVEHKSNMSYSFFIDNEDHDCFCPTADTGACIGKAHLDWREINELDIFKGYKFVPSMRFVTHFAFSKHNFVNDLNENAVSYDEEIIQTIELFNKGYQFVFPILEKSPTYHLHWRNNRARLKDFMNDDEYRNWNIRIVDNILSYIKENPKKVEKWCDYANVDILKGTKEVMAFPTSFPTISTTTSS